MKFSISDILIIAVVSVISVYGINYGLKAVNLGKFTTGGA